MLRNGSIFDYKYPYLSSRIYLYLYIGYIYVSKYLDMDILLYIQDPVLLSF